MPGQPGLSTHSSRWSLAERVGPAVGGVHVRGTRPCATNAGVAGRPSGGLISDSCSCGVISTLRTQEEGDRSHCALLDCLCSWGHVGHVLELLCDWLPQEQPPSKVGPASQALGMGAAAPHLPSRLPVPVAPPEQLSFETESAGARPAPGQARAGPGVHRVPAHPAQEPRVSARCSPEETQPAPESTWRLKGSFVAGVGTVKEEGPPRALGTLSWLTAFLLTGSLAALWGTPWAPLS